MHLSRRSVLTGSAAAAAVFLPDTAGAAALPADVSRAIVDSTMARFTPVTFGGWSYHKALYLYGQYLVYKRTGERRYFDFIQAWVDRYVTDAGISNTFNSLDSMRPAQLLPLLYAETGLWKYRTAAEQVRRRIGTYPRTTDGALIHNVTMKGELWCDGVYMALPFLAAYGRTFGDAEYCYDQVGKNMAVYFKHLKSANGLLFHAYDQDGSAPWAKSNGGRSTVHWGRATGWFGMTAVDLLEILPAGHPRRAGLIDIVRHLAAGYRRYQGASTGMWYYARPITGPVTPATDLARGRTTFPTSPLPAGMGEPAHAVDGDPGTAWRPGPDGRMVVDLAATRTVSTVTLTWTGGARPAAAITTSTDATTYLPFAAPATARYVAVAVPGWRGGDPELIELAVR